jgi:hypothetical protein
MCNDMVYMYCGHTGSILIFLNRSLQESLLLEFVVILLYIFFNTEHFNPGCCLPPKIIPLSYNGMYIKKKKIILNVS